MAEAVERSTRKSKTRVNILKKVKVGGAWKLCAAVPEANGKLKDRIRVGGRVELHSEGKYYIEWRENGQRRREAIAERSDVRERVRLKALELEALRAGIEIGSSRNHRAPVPVIMPRGGSRRSTRRRCAPIGFGSGNPPSLRCLS